MYLVYVHVEPEVLCLALSDRKHVPLVDSEKDCAVMLINQIKLREIGILD